VKNTLASSGRRRTRDVKLMFRSRRQRVGACRAQNNERQSARHVGKSRDRMVLTVGATASPILEIDRRYGARLRPNGFVNVIERLNGGDAGRALDQ
jgi:hypothetical protein